MQKQKFYAVLTGDIVNSSKLTASQLKSVRGRLSASIKALEQSLGKTITIGEIDFYRGDGWQMLLDEPYASLQAAVFLRAALISEKFNDTRISVGIGTVRDINKQKISTSTGEAFEYSGTGLDKLKKRKLMTISGQLTPQKLEISVFELCDAIIQQWTARQAQAVYLAMQGLDQSQAAANIEPPTTRQTIDKLLTNALWNAVEGAIDIYSNCN